MPAISWPNNYRSGFTLIEVLVVAPLVILIIGVLVAAIVSLTGSSLTAQARNELSSNVYSSLSSIEHDLSISGKIISETGNLISPQGSNNGTAGFNLDADTLVVQVPALSTNLLDDERQPIFYQDKPNACSSPNVVLNDIVYVTNIYFVNDNSLWQRTILPDDVGSACETPWQKNTCQPGQSGSRCSDQDERLLSLGDEGSVEFSYFELDNDPAATSDTEDISTVGIKIKASKNVAGRLINSSGSLKITID